MSRRYTIFGIGLIAFLVIESAYIGYRWWLDYWSVQGATPEERGYRLALRLGCFTCHGPGATQAIESPLGDAPPWDGGTWMMYVKNEEHIRNWILYGEKEPSPEKTAPIPFPPKELTMPPYRGQISDEQLNDLVAFYKAVAWFRQPSDPLVARGREIAQEKGCFHCHGPEGRLTPPNPGSLKGYIPAWNGPDFDKLVRDERELREWILDGIPARFQRNPIARFFLKRAVIKMPAFRGHITDEELDALIAFIQWVRQGESRPLLSVKNAVR